MPRAAPAEAAALDWTEKYRPRSLGDVVGNPRAVQDLKKWAEAWRKGKPEYRAVLLYGAPGTGKTSAALALAAEMGWGCVEMNASDQRTRAAVERLAGRGALSATFSSAGDYLRPEEGGFKLILLDEADALHGRDEAVGGLRAIVATLQRTEQPVVLVANDRYALTRRASALRDLCLGVEFHRLRKDEVAKALRRILEAERVPFEDEALLGIAERAEGDLRSAVKDLQAIALGRGRVARAGLEALGDRERRSDLWALVRTVLATRDAREARDAAQAVDEEPRNILTWIEDNVPLWYQDRQDLARAFRALARSDIFLGRALATQQYRLWGYATDLMTAGVALSKAGEARSGRLTFPVWVRRMGASKHARAMRKSVGQKLGRATHTSAATALEDFVPLLRLLLARDPQGAARTAVALGLEEAEIAFLLGEKATKAHLKAILDAMEALREAEAPEPPPEEEPRAEEEAEAASAAKAGGKPARQKGLFDF